MKLFVTLLCCFVPLKKWRKKIRHNLIRLREEKRKLESFGCIIENEILTTPTGVKIDVSKSLDNSLYLVLEVFFSSEYNLNIFAESVLIDIGMNRSAASLLFASNEHIKKIYSYEPFAPTFELAKKNLLLNPELSKKIIPHNFGLGKTETTLELPYSSSASAGMSTTHRDKKKHGDTQNEIVYIKDSAKEFKIVLENNKNKCLIVKCDCEGAEFEIFERLEEAGIIGKIDVVIMEYHFEKPDRLINILTGNNFAVQVKPVLSKFEIGYIFAVRMGRHP